MTCFPPTPPYRRHRQHGFTAIELMVVVAIVAVLAAMAAPSFSPLLERWRVRQTAEALQSTLYFARSEAIKRGGDISIETTGSSWSDGWKVIHTANNVGTVLQETPSPSKVTVTLANNASGKVSADRWGMLMHSGGTAAVVLNFAVVPEGKAATDANAARLCAAPGGRIVQKKGTESC